MVSLATPMQQTPRRWSAFPDAPMRATDCATGSDDERGRSALGTIAAVRQRMDANGVSGKQEFGETRMRLIQWNFTHSEFVLLLVNAFPAATPGPERLTNRLLWTAPSGGFSHARSYTKSGLLR